MKTVGGERELVRLEQTCTGCVQNVFDYFSKPGELVVHLFHDSLATVGEHQELPPHRRFTGCKDDAKYFAASTEELVETYAKKVLNKKSDMSGSDKVVNACKILFQALDRLQARKEMRSCKMLVGTCPVWSFPSHIRHFFLNMLWYPLCLEKGVKHF